MSTYMVWKATLLDFLTKNEQSFLKNKAIFPSISLNILKKIKFTCSEEEITELVKGIRKGYAPMISLNHELDLRLQFHGRFNSFLIGFGVNPDNENQPD